MRKREEEMARWSECVSSIPECQGLSISALLACHRRSTPLFTDSRGIFNWHGWLLHSTNSVKVGSGDCCHSPPRCSGPILNKESSPEPKRSSREGPNRILQL